MKTNMKIVRADKIGKHTKLTSFQCERVLCNWGLERWYKNCLYSMSFPEIHPLCPVVGTGQRERKLGERDWFVLYILKSNKRLCPSSYMISYYRRNDITKLTKTTKTLPQVFIWHTLEIQTYQMVISATRTLWIKLMF